MTDSEFQKRLCELEAQAKKATRGSWKVLDGKNVATEEGIIIAEVTIPPLGYGAEKVAETDAQFMASANPAFILEMIAKIRKLNKEANWLASRVPRDGDTCIECMIGPDCNTCRREFWRKQAQKAVNLNKGEHE